MDVTRQLLKTWPKIFQIPVNLFSEELQFALQSGELSWRAKSELLGHLSREILKFTYKPSVNQRDQVAKELISLFPSLKSNIGEGHHGWSQKIYDRMNEEAKRCNVGTKRSASTEGIKRVKLPRRGEVNFIPDVLVGNIIDSKEFLVEEARKPLKDQSLENIKEHMTMTFSDRRAIVAEKILVKELKNLYPILFSECGILVDFKLLNNIDLESCFMERLEICAEKIVEEANLQQNKHCKEILKQHTDSMITALMLLPHLLGDTDFSFLYRIYPIETEPDIVKMSGPETPHVAVLGDINDINCLCYIAVEKDIIISVFGFVKAVMLMFGVYYCCNMEYSKEVTRTLKFVQTYILQMPEYKRLPSKLLTFCSRLTCQLQSCRPSNS